MTAEVILAAPKPCNVKAGQRIELFNTTTLQRQVVTAPADGEIVGWAADGRLEYAEELKP